MIAAMDWLSDRRGAQVVKFAMLEPTTTPTHWPPIMTY